MVRGAALLLAVLVVAACGPLSAEGLLPNDCERAERRPGTVPGAGKPTDDGQPFAGHDVAAMTIAEVEDIAQAANLDTSWRLAYGVGADRESGFSECWCVPPPDGAVTALFYDTGGRLVAMVDSGMRLASVRAQPAEGWGC